jgi:23S rRNA U2552 (ribose-2'-O)-methylase RlmE/FtsJ
VDGLTSEMRRMFGRVAVRKPSASRAASREIYLLGRQFTVKRAVGAPCPPRPLAGES